MYSTVRPSLFICPMSVFYLSNDWDWVEPRKAFHILPRGQKSHFRAEAYTFHFERATPFLGKYIPVTPCYRRSHFQRHESRGNPFLRKYACHAVFRRVLTRLGKDRSFLLKLPAYRRNRVIIINRIHRNFIEVQ